MPLNNAPILVMCWDAPTAHALVNVISAARGDVVYAANAGEALQRLQQFSFNAAVLGWEVGA
jgi:streptogramin lyase